MLKNIQFITIKKSISLSLLLLIITLFSTGASTEKSVSIIDIYGRDYIPLDELVKVFSIEHNFDPVFQKGKLYHKSHYMIYKTGYSCIIIDNSIAYSEYPVIRWKGGIFIPIDLANTLLDNFYNKDIQRKKNKLVILEDEYSDKKPDKEIILQKKEKIGFIILDAGHGGKDPGAIGKGGVMEKNITLTLAKNVEALLKKKGINIKIKLTRTTDKFIELSERAEIANRELKKGINGTFVSIHVNASVSNKISGFETYMLSQNPTNEEARKTAALENNVVILENQKTGGKKYNDIDYIEALMITTQIQRESLLLANSVQNNLKTKVKEFKSRGVNKADFFVLRGALMPAVLIEVGFITHPKEMEYLQRSDYQEKLTAGIVDGIINFINQYNKLVD
ncbi:MAG: N-acetylmuramoyl-L-alanine amidase [Spirochaetes bacterium]|nr:N-acetylmuramoyl-L-alanine amidase [Spirochaetota bacterium]